MSRPPIADDLREYADYLHGCETISEDDHMVLAHIANKIDTEHRTRMYQQSRDIRKSACRYFASVVEDYKCGRKRQVREKEEEVNNHERNQIDRPPV